MADVHWHGRPDLRHPALICAFKGWNDGAEAATTAVQYLRESWEGAPICHIDGDPFYDFQESRPKVHVEEGKLDWMVWPDARFYGARIPDAPRDVLLLEGIEPNTHWRRFCAAIIEVAYELEVEAVVTVGSLLAAVPHTFPVQVSAIATDPELLKPATVAMANYEGPAGIVGALHWEIAQAGLPAASLWAAVPHYLAGAPNPKAALALTRRITQVLGTALDPSRLKVLEEAVKEFEDQVGDAVKSDPRVQKLITDLEEQARETTKSGLDSASGDALASEIERFLRDQENS